MKSKSLVAAQFGLLLLIILIGETGDDALTEMCVLFGLFIGIWAVATMKFKVSIIPDVREDQEFITTGPYKYVRHPMYSSILAIALGFVIGSDSLLILVLAILLLIVLLKKIDHEEKLLKKHFKNYEKEFKNTKRLIPFIY